MTVLNAIAPFSESEFFGGNRGGIRYRRAKSITDDALQAVDSAAAKKFFLFVNYFDAHDPYQAPPASISEAYEVWREARDTGLADAVSSMMRNEVDLSPARRHALAKRYDRELGYLDQELSRLLERLRQHPAWKKMLLIITSDHGEAFGEHRLVRHSNTSV